MYYLNAKGQRHSAIVNNFMHVIFYLINDVRLLQFVEYLNA